MVHVERILLAVAALALGWYATASAGTMLYQASQNRQLEQMRLERTVDSNAAAPAEVSPSHADRPAPRAADEAEPKPAMPALSKSAHASGPASRPTAVESSSASARGLIGRIEIPRVGLSAIVREGVDDRTLRRAVGHVPETPRPGDPGNVAFAGHRDTFFRPLKQVRIGDRIRVATPDGDFDYVVTATRIVGPDDVSVLAGTSEPALTLITCFPFNMAGPAPDRFIVRATAVSR